MARVHGAEMKRRSSHELSGLVMSADRCGQIVHHEGGRTEPCYQQPVRHKGGA